MTCIWGFQCDKTINHVPGIKNSDSQTWMFTRSETAQSGKAVKLISWIHSHVRGASCQFSSIDVHSQFSMSRLYDGITGIVIKISSNGTCDTFDAFTLTSVGQKKIQQCKEDSRHQHASCSSKKGDNQIKFSKSQISGSGDPRVQISPNFGCRPYGPCRIDCAGQPAAS